MRCIEQRIVFPIRSVLLSRPLLYEFAKTAYFRALDIYYFLRTGRPRPPRTNIDSGVFEGHRDIEDGSYYVSAAKGLVCRSPSGAGLVEKQISSYDAYYQDQQSFDHCETDVRVIAYHLPQFHATPENDMWWGKGFTEWTNTRKTAPLFPGHYHPREPHDDIGYYDLSDVEALKKQANLAKRHGIYGFVFYHYWFHGRRLLGKPVDALLAHPEIDLPFCLCWANETWSKRWDGKDHHILVKQTFSPEDDIRFIEFLAPFFRDPRYIRVDGKPLLQVYRVRKLPCPRSTAERWRSWCRKNGIGEIHLVAVTHSEITPSDDDLKEVGFDAYAAFTPHNFPCQHIPADESLFDGGYRFDYTSGVDIYEKSPSQPEVYECCTLGWDNTARFGNRGMIYLRFSLKAYHRWLSSAIRRTREKFMGDRRILFLNAWNEWAEGAHLEPDRKYGYALLNTTSKAIFGLPLADKERDQHGGEASTSTTSAETADKYTKDYEWLRYTIETGAENSLTKVDSMLSDSAEILEFGPAAGYFTKYLKEQRQAIVDIIEIDEECAQRARAFARDTFVGDIERDDWRKFVGNRRYDFILFADVLEHLREPQKILTQSAAFLKPKGKIIISVPNVGHWQIVASLINNDFSYNDVGIMDRTHLRFFTEPTLRQMVLDSGLKPVAIEPVLFPDLPVSCGTKWNVCNIPNNLKHYLRSRAYGNAIQIVACCSSNQDM